MVVRPQPVRRPGGIGVALYGCLALSAPAAVCEGWPEPVSAVAPAGDDRPFRMAIVLGSLWVGQRGLSCGVLLVGGRLVPGARRHSGQGENRRATRPGRSGRLAADGGRNAAADLAALCGHGDTAHAGAVPVTRSAGAGSVDRAGMESHPAPAYPDSLLGKQRRPRSALGPGHAMGRHCARLCAASADGSRGADSVHADIGSFRGRRRVSGVPARSRAAGCGRGDRGQAGAARGRA